MNYVAPLVGAWIEISLPVSFRLHLLSLLSWERGLKYGVIKNTFEQILSLLSWERGLKFG